MATCEASQWVEATTPKVPRISGRVVKVLMREEPISVITDTDSMLTRITAETLREQARRYINPDNHISGWLLPADQTLREEGQPAGEPVPAAP